MDWPELAKSGVWGVGAGVGVYFFWEENCLKKIKRYFCYYFVDVEVQEV